MAYQDIDRRSDGTISGIRSHTGSFGPRGVPYIFTGAATSETRVQFDFTTEWFQISATTTDAVRFAFKNDGTDSSGGQTIAANTSSPIFHVSCDELYVINDYSIIAKLSNVASGSTHYFLDER
jgi:hypothetical protein